MTTCQVFGCGVDKGVVTVDGSQLCPFHASPDRTVTQAKLVSLTLHRSHRRRYLWAQRPTSDFIIDTLRDD